MNQILLFNIIELHLRWLLLNSINQVLKNTVRQRNEFLLIRWITIVYHVIAWNLRRKNHRQHTVSDIKIFIGISGEVVGKVQLFYKYKVSYTSRFSPYGSLFCDKVASNEMIAEKILILSFGSILQVFNSLKIEVKEVWKLLLGKRKKKSDERFPSYYKPRKDYHDLELTTSNKLLGKWVPAIESKENHSKCLCMRIGWKKEKKKSLWCVELAETNETLNAKNSIYFKH